MQHIKLNRIYINDGLKNGMQIKRGLITKYGIALDYKINKRIKDNLIVDKWIEIYEGEPWFGKNGILNIEVILESSDGDRNHLFFKAHWNHTCFITSDEIIEKTEWS